MEKQSFEPRRAPERLLVFYLGFLLLPLLGVFLYFDNQFLPAVIARETMTPANGTTPLDDMGSASVGPLSPSLVRE